VLLYELPSESHCIAASTFCLDLYSGGIMLKRLIQSCHLGRLIGWVSANALTNRGGGLAAISRALSHSFRTIIMMIRSIVLRLERVLTYNVYNVIVPKMRTKQLS
jgi:hypothetical protein